MAPPSVALLVSQSFQDVNDLGSDLLPSFAVRRWKAPMGLDGKAIYDYLASMLCHQRYRDEPLR